MHGSTLFSNKKRCHLVVNVVNSAVQWHYLVDKVGAGDGRGSPRLVRGQVKLNRFIFSDHLPLRGVGGLYQEIKSAIDQH